MHSPDEPPGKNWAVVRAVNGKATEESGAIDRQYAEDIFDAYAIEVRGAYSWNAVLDRLLERKYAPQLWVGSPVEYVSARLPVGTWAWVLALVEIRKLNLDYANTGTTEEKTG